MPTITFDRFIQYQLGGGQDAIKLVKIDVEGNELQVLEGMSRRLIDNLIVEYSPYRVVESGGDPLRFFQILDAHFAKMALLSSTHSAIESVEEIVANIDDLIGDKFSFFDLHVVFPTH